MVPQPPGGENAAYGAAYGEHQCLHAKVLKTSDYLWISAYLNSKEEEKCPDEHCDYFGDSCGVSATKQVAETDAAKHD